MPITRLKAICVALMTLFVAAITTPNVNAAPVSAGLAPISQSAGQMSQALTTDVRWHRRRGYRRVYYGRPRYYRPVRAYRPRYYRPARYYRPRYYRPVPVYRGPRCRIVYRTVFDGWGYVNRPVRICR